MGTLVCKLLCHSRFHRDSCDLFHREVVEPKPFVPALATDRVRNIQKNIIFFDRLHARLKKIVIIFSDLFAKA